MDSCRYSAYYKWIILLEKQKRIEAVFISISDRDVKTYNRAIVELGVRIIRIIDESGKIHDAIENMQTFGL